MGVRGFDSNMILVLRGGILMSIGDFPESLGQAVLVGCNVCREIGRTSSFVHNNNNTNNSHNNDNTNDNTDNYYFYVIISGIIILHIVLIIVCLSLSGGRHHRSFIEESDRSFVRGKRSFVRSSFVQSPLDRSLRRII